MKLTDQERINSFIKMADMEGVNEYNYRLSQSIKNVLSSKDNEISELKLAIKLYCDDKAIANKNNDLQSEISQLKEINKSHEGTIKMQLSALKSYEEMPHKIQSLQGEIQRRNDSYNELNKDHDKLIEEMKKKEELLNRIVLLLRDVYKSIPVIETRYPEVIKMFEDYLVQPTTKER